MGRIRDKNLARRKKEQSGSEGPKTIMGNYNRIKRLQRRIQELEDKLEKLES